ncbi:hypothetical protein ACFTAO_05125 [Paenibacillus rhizoplanae]
MERLDILVTVQLFVGLLIKMMIFYFCSVKSSCRADRQTGQMVGLPCGGQSSTAPPSWNGITPSISPSAWGQA